MRFRARLRRLNSHYPDMRKITRRNSPYFLNYIKITSKRCGKLLPVILGETLVLFLGLSLIFSILWQDSHKSEVKMKFRIGITGETASEYFSLGIMALEHLDASRFMVEFDQLDETSAEEKLQKGSLDAYVLVPEGFLRSLMTGENIPVELHTTEGAADIGVLLIREVADLVYRIIYYAQAACINYYDVMSQAGMEGWYEDHIADLDMALLTATLARDDLYDIQIVSAYGDMSWGGYYLCALYLLLLLLMGIHASGLLANRNEELLQLLHARGLGWAEQVAVEYGGYFLLMTLIAAIITAILHVGMVITGWLPMEWNYAEASIIWSFLLQSLPVILLVSALQYMLYECTPNLVTGIILQFTGAISLAYISGCIYPLSFFPAQVAALNRFLPTGIARSCLCDIMADQDMSRIQLLLAYTALFLAASILIRRLRMEAVRGGGA